MMKTISTIALLTFPVPALADFHSMVFATELGAVIGAEEICGLDYDQEAIQQLIDEKADPEDLGFPSQLNMMIQGSQYMAEDWTGSAKTAQCRAVENTAREYGFID